MYRGISSPLAGVAAINAICFGVYGNVNRRLKDPDSLKSITIAGMASGFVQVFPSFYFFTLSWKNLGDGRLSNEPHCDDRGAAG